MAHKTRFASASPSITWAIRVRAVTPPNSILSEEGKKTNSPKTARRPSREWRCLPC